jgi:hypothetical protein
MLERSEGHASKAAGRVANTTCGTSYAPVPVCYQPRWRKKVHTNVDVNVLLIVAGEVRESES